MELFKLLGTIALSGVAQAQKDIDDTSGKASSFGENLKKGITTVGKWGVAIGTAAVAGGTAISKMASNFEDSMAKVGTIADESEVSMDSMQKSILDLSDQTGISSSEIAENVYNAISAGQKTSDAVNFVSNATKLAKAGFAESGAALDILSTIMNAYGLEAEQVTKVSDNLITTQNLGKTTVAELAAAMGKAIPTAKSVGVNLDELCASYAVMTANGIATAETTTYLNSMMNELGKDGTSAANAFAKGTGLTMKEAMDNGWGLSDVLSVLNEEAKKSGTSINNLFGSAEAGKAAAVLWDNSKKLEETVVSMGKSSGATETAYNKMDSTVSSKADKLITKIKNMGITLGQKLLPVVVKVLELIINNMPVIQGMFDKLAPVLEDIFNDILPLLADLINKFLPVIVDLVDDLLPIVSQLVKSVLPIFVDIIKTIVPPLAQIVEAILPPLKSLLDIILPILSGFLEALQPILDVVVSLLQPILDLIGQGLNALAEAFGFAKEKTDAAVQAARDEADAMRDMRDAANEARDAIDQKAEKELANVSTVESLWQELQNLADEQGNVSEKDRARAEFITGQLSEALGTEIQWTGNQVQNYKDLQEEIDKTIEKKKMEILLEASEEKYKTAIQNRTDAEDRLNEASQRVADAFAKRAELEAQGVSKSSQAWKDATAVAAAAQEAFVDAQDIVGEYYADISQYETAQTLIMQGENEKALELLDKKGQAFQSASDLAAKSADEQKAILEKQMEDAAVNLSNQVELYNKMSKNCTDEEREMYEKNLKEAQDYFTRSSQEYTKAGGEIGENFFKSMSSKLTSWQFESVGSYMIQGIANGAEGNKTTLMQKLGKIMNEAFSSVYPNRTSGRTSSNTSTSSPYKTPHLAKGGVLKRGQIGFLEGDGDEAVVPLEKNTGWINKLADRLNSSGGGDVVKKMDELIKAITSMNIVLDTGTMVGEIAPAMDAQLGNIYSAKERGM